MTEIGPADVEEFHTRRMADRVAEQAGQAIRRRHPWINVAGGPGFVVVSGWAGPRC